MKIVTWNVNSIKARLEHVKRYLGEAKPDVLMIQELKTAEFPLLEFEGTGYNIEYVGQKAYNGVAIISKHDINVVNTALPGDDNDEQARFIEADIGGIRLINIYLPNGNPTPGEKFDYKLSWMERLKHHLSALVANDHPFIIGGDFNVIPEEHDCYDPKVWKDDALFRIETRHAFQSLENLGLYDAFRIFDTRKHQFTFWDYQRGAWQRDNGIRIDHFLVSPTLTDKLTSCVINKTPRGWDKPSDHTPVELTLDIDQKSDKAA